MILSVNETGFQLKYLIHLFKYKHCFIQTGYRDVLF